MLQLKTYNSPSHLYSTVMSLPVRIIGIFIFSITIISCGYNKSPNLTPTQQDAPSQLVREKGKGSPGGIPNLGATCYMNSVLQILKSFYLPKVNEKSDELAKSLQNLMEIIADDREVANKAEAMAVFKALNAPFIWTKDERKQMDAEELLANFFDWMNLPRATTKYVKINSDGAEEPSNSSDAWFIHRIEMPSEKKNLNTMQDYFDNSLEGKSIKAKFKNSDTKNSDLKRQPKLDNLDTLYQEILVVQLVRFATEGGARLSNGSYGNDYEERKIEKAVQVPMKLTVRSTQTVKKDKDQDYSLIGFIHHIGNINGGHYLTYVKKGDKWTCYNDNQVNPITEKVANENAKKAYLFFYQPSHSQRTP